MKTLRILAPVILGLSAFTGTSSVNAQAVIDTVDNGNLSVTRLSLRSGCAVLFNPQGELLQNGRSCSARDISEAQTAIDRYLREQGTPEGDDRTSLSQGLTLICYGEGRRPSIASRNSYEWDDRSHRYALRDRVESSTEDFDSDVQVEIRDMKGRIHLTRKLIAPINSGGTDGWWNLNDLKITPDRITGRYRINGLNKPRVTIDRRSGRIAIDAGTSFRGSCDAGNWSDRRNRF
ncbi:hypothetical protein [Nostoc sp.]|uniref:hypothetical protein n=1 Tax=Nostoc sp. TaxID=1180 RepID=UPI002FF44ED8